MRQARQARDLTQVALAEMVGITQGYLSEIERGTRGTSPELLGKIAEVLDCPVIQLERRRPLSCPTCDYRHDVPANGLVPLHTLPGSGDWCPSGGSPVVTEEAAA